MCQYNHALPQQQSLFTQTMTCIIDIKHQKMLYLIIENQKRGDRKDEETIIIHTYSVWRWPSNGI